MKEYLVKQIIVIGETIQFVLQKEVIMTTINKIKLQFCGEDINNNNAYAHVEKDGHITLLGSTWPQLMEGLEALNFKLPEDKIPCYGCHEGMCSVLCTGALRAAA